MIPELMPAARLEQAPETKSPSVMPEARMTGRLTLTAWARRFTLSEHPQVACKLSGLGMFSMTGRPKTSAPCGKLPDQFGAGGCMFGSNFPVDSLYSDYTTLFMDPPLFRWRTVRFQHTAAAFYGLTPAGDRLTKYWLRHLR